MPDSYDSGQTNARSNVQSVDRVFDIIEELSCFSRGMHLSDLAAKLNLHTSTVHRLLNTLVQRGYVHKDSSTGKYRLTMRLFEIGSRVIGDSNIVSLAKPMLDHLADITGEAIHLVIPQEDEVVYLYKSDAASSMVRMGSSVGLHNPMYCTGVGKALLACRSDEEIRTLWNRTKFVKYTKNTITGYEQMLHELEQIRKRGYSIDDEEHEVGIRCIATVVKDIRDIPVAAISISAPVNRLGQEKVLKYSQSLIAAADDISSLLGNTGSKPR